MLDGFSPTVAITTLTVENIRVTCPSQIHAPVQSLRVYVCNFLLLIFRDLKAQLKTKGLHLKYVTVNLPVMNLS